MTQFTPSPSECYAATGPVRALIAATRALPGGWLTKRLGFALRRVAIMLLRGQPVDQDSLGARFRLYPYNNVCEKRILFAPRDFDQTERAICSSADYARDSSSWISARISADTRSRWRRWPGRMRASSPLSRNPRFSTGWHSISQSIRSERSRPSRSLWRTGRASSRFSSIPRNKGEASVEDRQRRSMRGQVQGAGPDLLGDHHRGGLDACRCASKLDVEGAEDLDPHRQFFADAPRQRSGRRR